MHGHQEFVSLDIYVEGRKICEILDKAVEKFVKLSYNSKNG
jgi:hypothetical protein